MQIRRELEKQSYRKWSERCRIVFGKLHARGVSQAAEAEVVVDQELPEG